MFAAWPQDSSFPPGLTVWLPFLLAGLALNLTPGADMACIIAGSAAQGRAAGVVPVLAIFTGVLGHVFLAAAGLAAGLAARLALVEQAGLVK